MIPTKIGNGVTLGVEELSPPLISCSHQASSTRAIALLTTSINSSWQSRETVERKSEILVVAIYRTPIGMN